MKDIDRRIIRTYQISINHFNEKHFNELIQMEMFVDFGLEPGFLRLIYHDLIIKKGFEAMIPVYSLSRINWKRCLKALEEIYNTSSLKIEREVFNKC